MTEQMSPLGQLLNLKMRQRLAQEGDDMKLAITGRQGAGLCEWDDYALLRDNVQHYVEAGTQGGRFRALHGIASAVDGRQCVVDAVRLRVEVLQAWEALSETNLEQAAVSTRTLSIRDGSPIPSCEGTTSLIAPQSWLKDRSIPVPKAAQAFVAAVLSLTRTAVAGDVLHVRRLPSTQSSVKRNDEAES